MTIMHIISVFLTHRKAEKGKEPKVVTHRPQPSALTGDAATVTRIPEKASKCFFSLKRKGKQVCARMLREFLIWNHWSYVFLSWPSKNFGSCGHGFNFHPKLERPAALPREFVFRVVVMHQLQYCNAECRSWHLLCLFFLWSDDIFPT